MLEIYHARFDVRTDIANTISSLSISSLGIYNSREMFYILILRSD